MFMVKHLRNDFNTHSLCELDAQGRDFLITESGRGKMSSRSLGPCGSGADARFSGTFFAGSLQQDSFNYDLNQLPPKVLGLLFDLREDEWIFL